MASNSDMADSVSDLARSVDALVSKTNASERAIRALRDRIGTFENEANFPQTAQLVIETGRSATRAHDRAEDAGRAASLAASSAAGAANAVERLESTTQKQIESLTRRIGHAVDARKRIDAEFKNVASQVERIEDHARSVALVSTRTGEAVSGLIDSDAEHSASIESLTGAIRDLGHMMTAHGERLRQIEQTTKRAAKSATAAVDAHTGVKALSVQISQLRTEISELASAVASGDNRSRHDQSATNNRIETLAGELEQLSSHVSLLRELSGGAMESRPAPAVAGE